MFWNRSSQPSGSHTYSATDGKSFSTSRGPSASNTGKGSFFSRMLARITPSKEHMHQHRRESRRPSAMVGKHGLPRGYFSWMFFIMRILQLIVLPAAIGMMSYFIYNIGQAWRKAPSELLASVSTASILTVWVILTMVAYDDRKVRYYVTLIVEGFAVVLLVLVTSFFSVPFHNNSCSDIAHLDLLPSLTAFKNSSFPGVLVGGSSHRTNTSSLHPRAGGSTSGGGSSGGKYNNQTAKFIPTNLTVLGTPGSQIALTDFTLVDHATCTRVYAAMFVMITLSVLFTLSFGAVMFLFTGTKRPGRRGRRLFAKSDDEDRAVGGGLLHLHNEGPSHGTAKKEPETTWGSGSTWGSNNAGPSRSTTMPAQ